MIDIDEVIRYCGAKGIVCEFLDCDPYDHSMESVLLTTRVKGWHKGHASLIISYKTTSTSVLKRKILDYEKRGWIDDPVKYMTDVVAGQ